MATDSLLNLASPIKPDINRQKIWLRLEEYQVCKPREHMAGMDSIPSYAIQSQRLVGILTHYQSKVRCLNLLNGFSSEHNGHLSFSQVRQDEDIITVQK
jgi:hypothetical protein